MGGGERNVGECLVVENVDIGVSDYGSEGVNEMFGRDFGLRDVEGIVVWIEGFGWLYVENSGWK